MEFRGVFEESAVWSEREEYADSNVGSDEETLSLSDLPIYENAGMSAELESTSRDSNAGHSDHHDLDFDFDLGRCGSAVYQSCPADDLFQDGRLLPLTYHRCWTASNAAEFPGGKSSSRRENRILLNEKLRAWRTESVDSQFSYSASNKKFLHSNSTTPGSKSKSKPYRAAACTSPKPPPPSSSKIYNNLKWHEFFTLGLMKTPPMKLEEIRLRQGKPEKSVLKRSVSCNYEEGPKLAKSEPRAASFQHKSTSARGEETSRYKGWRMFAPLNGCKASANSVINCSTANKRGDRGDLEDQNLQNSPAGFLKTSGFRHEWNMPPAYLQARPRAPW